MPESHVMVTDAPEACGSVLNNADALRALRECAPFLEMVYISNSYRGSKVTKRLLRFAIRLPAGARNLDQLDPLMELVFFFVDHVSRLRLAPNVAQAVRARRQKAGKKKKSKSKSESKMDAKQRKHEKRQATAQRLKLERERAKREKLAKMTDGERAKHEEREHKRKMKKRQRSKITVMRS